MKFPLQVAILKQLMIYFNSSSFSYIYPGRFSFFFESKNIPASFLRSVSFSIYMFMKYSYFAFSITSL